MDNNDNENFVTAKIALRIIIQRKSNLDNLELVRAISNLSRASKTYNCVIDDSIIILSCKNITGGGCRFARNKFYGYINTSNATKFIACADAISQHYHRSVYIHIFRKCLIDIVKNCSYEFLSKYITFLTSRGMIYQYYGEKQPNGFKPLELVKALQISNENGWADKALLLFQHLVDYYSVPIDWSDAKRHQIEEIKQRISKNFNLNFDGQLGNRIRQIRTQLTHATVPLGSLLAPKRMELSKVPKEVFDLPIEQQPWFFGHVEHPGEVATDCATSGAFLVVFQGSKLMAHVRGHQSFHFHPNYLKDTTTKFYMHNDGVVHYLHLYEFYRSLVQQDLDALRAIQETHNIDWKNVIEGLKQPNPFIDLLVNVTAPRDEIVQYLIDIGVPTVLAPWPYTPIHDNQVAVFDKLLSVGAKIDTSLFIELLRKKPFMNISQMKKLVSAWQMDRYTSGRLLSFILFTFPHTLKREGYFSERKLTVLWIYKFGQSDGCNYLQTLPKELIRLIIEYMDEQPLFFELALMITKLPDIDYSYSPTIGDLQRSPYYGQVLVEGTNMYAKRSVMEDIVHYMRFAYLRENYHWIRRALCEQESLNLVATKMKLVAYMMKNETDITIFRHLHRHLQPVPGYPWPIIDAFKANNRTALQFYVEERDDFVMPSRDEFEAKVKPPKYSMTYEQALSLVDEILSNKK